ncbi:MAG: hypothetical protein UFJ18_05300 [Blautia sp.]|nr:hypothetical protein [Blautia sp.]
MLLLSQTVRAEWTGGSSSGGINDGAVTGNGTYATYGVKFSLARRADMLTEGDINKGNYAGYTRGGAGVVVLKRGDGLYSTSADRNDVVNDAQEFIVDNGELVTVSNANVSTQEAAALLEVDANSLDSTLRNMVDEGAYSGISFHHTEVLNRVLESYGFTKENTLSKVALFITVSKDMEVLDGKMEIKNRRCCWCYRTYNGMEVRSSSWRKSIVKGKTISDMVSAVDALLYKTEKFHILS